MGRYKVTKMGADLEGAERYGALLADDNGVRMDNVSDETVGLSDDFRRTYQRKHYVLNLEFLQRLGDQTALLNNYQVRQFKPEQGKTQLGLKEHFDGREEEMVEAVLSWAPGISVIQSEHDLVDVFESYDDEADDEESTSYVIYRHLVCSTVSEKKAFMVRARAVYYAICLSPYRWHCVPLSTFYSRCARPSRFKMPLRHGARMARGRRSRRPPTCFKSPTR